MKNLFFILLIIVIPFFSSAQFECGTPDDSTQLGAINLGCYTSINYAPDEFEQIKHVRITVHVIRADDGSGNFQDTQVERDWIENSLIGTTNNVMANLQPMNLATTSPYIQDSKIHFEIDDIYFHNDTYFWDYDLTGGMGNFIAGTKSNQFYSQYVLNNPLVINKTNSIHILLVKGRPNLSEGRACGINCTDWMVMGNVYQSYLAGNAWDPSRGIRHELGHNLGLRHSWGFNDYCDDTPPNNNLWNSSTGSNNVMDYNASKNALTECQLGKIHYNLQIYINNVVVDDCSIVEDVIISNGHTNTWNNTRKLKGNLIIEANSTLIVNCTVFMPEGGRIIVKPGGQLIVNEGIVSNDCGKMWNGIEVWGNNHTSQLDLATHGKVSILNGSLIENAHDAVRLHKVNNDNSNDISATGGIVIARNSTFKNNSRSFEFLEYQNFLPSSNANIRDLSEITDCNFIWDDNGSMVELGVLPRAHLTMYKTHNVTLRDNAFSNNASLGTYPNYQRAAGIATIDAEYKITNSTFNSLKIGIKAMGLNDIARVNISNNNFVDNRFGVMLEAARYPSVTENTFDIPISAAPVVSNNPQARGAAMSASAVVDAIGIYSTGSYGYNYEENTFSTSSLATPPPTLSNYGIISDNSTELGGLIYRNTYNNVIVDNIASKNNEKLTVDCNTHNAGGLKRYDMAVTSGELAPQGECNSNVIPPAKNTFNTLCALEQHVYHYNSNPSSVVYSAEPIDMPSCISLPEILRISCLTGSNSNTCPTNFGSSGGGTSNPLTLLAKIDANKAEQIAQENLIDGGDKNNLLNVINTQANGTVRNELLAASPYLSDEVLIAFLEKPNPLPAGHVKQIVVNNSPVTNNVQTVLDGISLSNGIRNQINAAQVGVSERSLLENQIKQIGKEVQLTKNEYVRMCLDSHQINDIETLLNTEKTVADKMALTAMVVSKDQAQAAQLIAELRADAVQLELLTPNSEKAEEIDKFCDYYTIVKDKISVSGSFSNLTPADELIIRELAATKDPIAINAQNALSFFKGETTERYAEAIVINPSASRGAGNDGANEALDVKQPYALNNYPNPFNENTIVAITLPEATLGTVVVTDVAGRQLKKVELNQTENQIEINGDELGYGIFFYSLYINGELVETKKMARMR